MSYDSKPPKISDGAARELRRAMFEKRPSKRIAKIRLEKRKKLGTNAPQNLGSDK
jgi:hypothetical protein